MARKKFTPFVLDEVQILDAAAEGKSIAKFNDKVIFVQSGVPGDVVQLEVFKNKRRFYEARILKVIKAGEKRIEAKCRHFGVCGGCKWQNMDYRFQLEYKQKQVFDNFTRIGKLEFEKIEPIAGCDEIYHYRNKLEFTFADRRWLTSEEIKQKDINANVPTLGFHVPERFDKILPVEECLLMHPFNNTLRNFVREKCIELGLSFYNHFEKSGDMRNIIMRNTEKGHWMVIVVFGSAYAEKHQELLKAMQNEFEQIKSLNFVVNLKLNDTISDQEVMVFAGDDHIVEELNGLAFKISPKSFFQTNSKQTLKLYSIAKEYAELTGDEIVYDLYTGTGTIANFVAGNAKKVVGVEYVEDAIIDAKYNSEKNNITNTTFYAGDMKDVLVEEFIKVNGRPDVIITDPPRSGMHNDVVEMIKRIQPKKLVYVSCNPATQARDLQLLSDLYTITKIQPVDMFPQTHHVECVVQCVLK